MKKHSVLILLAMLLGFAFTPGRAVGNSFSGQATVVQASVLGFPPITLVNAGPLPPEGGSDEDSLLNVSVPGLGSAGVLHAATVAMGDASRAEASVAILNVTAAGNTIGADFLMARAAAYCGQGGASIAGSSEIVGLMINGQGIVVTGDPNQTIFLPPPTGGKVVINEQSQDVQGNRGDITVTALHVTVPGLADVAISQAHADIKCTGKTCPSDKDFVTGGGRINTAAGKATFGVAGGIKNGGFWGHLTYIDHASGMKVKGTGVTAYEILNETKRRIKGNCEINGQGGYTYTVEVDDAGEPGRGDTFDLQLSNDYHSGGNLDGGNIQLHTCK